MKINETVYWQANEGYQTIGYDGEEKDVLDIKLSNNGLPCEVVVFDGSGRLLLAHAETTSDTAKYIHTYCIS